ncbi:MAG: hypothetical protein ACYDG3_10060 [Bacillati bacterium]
MGSKNSGDGLMKPLSELQIGDIIVIDGYDHNVAVVKDVFIPPGQEKYYNPIYKGYHLIVHPYSNLKDWRNCSLSPTTPVTVVDHINGVAQCSKCRYYLIPPRTWCLCELREHRLGGHQ